MTADNRWVAVKSADDFVKDIVEAEERGEFFTAHDIARQALDLYADNAELKYHAAFALARTGAVRQARQLYEEFRLAESEIEDYAALGPRLTKDLALALSGEDRRRLLSDAASQYEAVFRRTGGYYTAINAASMRLLAGDADAAARLASEVLTLTETGDDKTGLAAYYRLATRAEAFLITGKENEARRELEAAVPHAGAHYGALSTTRRQLSLIADATRADSAFLDLLVLPATVHYLGHMIAPPGEPGRFTADREEAVAEKIARALEDENVGIGYGGLACGADIMFAEALLARDAELHVVLPFRREEYVETSVRRGGGNWIQRFDACLDRANSISYATEDAYLGDDSLFTYGTRFAMGLALLRAKSFDSDVVQIALYDNEPPTGTAGTAVDVAHWRDHGRRTVVISVGEPRPNPVSSAKPAPRRSNQLSRDVRGILFGDIKGFSTLAERQVPIFHERIMRPIATALSKYGDRVLYKNTWGDAVYLVLSDAESAADCALDIQDLMASLDPQADGLPADIGLRLGGHVGPIFDGYDYVSDEPTFFGTHVTRAARLEPVTPTGHVYITEQFAAALAVEEPARFHYEYVGNLPMAKGYGAFRMYVLERTRTD